MASVYCVLVSLVVVAALSGQAYGLNCSQCVSTTENCTDVIVPCSMGESCFRASGRLWNGMTFQDGFLKGCAPCNSTAQACDYLNTTTIKSVFSPSAYIETCNLMCCTGENCNAGLPTTTTTPPTSTQTVYPGGGTVAPTSGTSTRVFGGLGLVVSVLVGFLF
ncbi:threonine-rich protein isoform X2 [Nematostella vectensis]|uniref:threonine-rich protein isoform X2 n=1 Tax=Nematostella vectensis TaxID=45351 RepID=UPI00138FD8FB|nr:threonine-rich protein isoform X2 [Nematostella vectensis]